MKSNHILHRISVCGCMAALLLYSANLHAEIINNFIPPGDLPAGSQYQLIFVTAGSRDATSANIDDYNTFVTQEAELNSYLSSGVTWWAVASTSAKDANENAETYDNIPIYNTHGQRIANGKTDLWDGSIQNAINYDQYGQVSSEPFVWTGSESDGTKQDNYGLLVGPLGSDSPYITFGSPTFDDEKWLDRGALRDYHETHSLYALSSQITIPEPGTLMLLGLGALCMAAFCRRQGLPRLFGRHAPSMVGKIGTVSLDATKMILLLGVAAIVLTAGTIQADIIFDNPNYTYTKILDVGSSVFTAESQFNYNGTKILWSEREVAAGETVGRAVKYGDWNALTHTISNVHTMDSSYDAGGHPVYISGAKWSPDGNYVGYMKYDPAWGETAPTQIWRYEISDGSTAAYYVPESGKEVMNLDFYGNSNTFVFWDDSSGPVDLFTYDGTNRSQLTNTARDEFEPRVFGSDASKVLFWSEGNGSDTYDSIHILNTDDDSVTDVALGSLDHDLYWPVWGKDQSYVGVVDAGNGTGANELLLYKKVGETWQLAEDLTGSGYTPEANNWNFFGSFLSNGSFCFQSQVGGSGGDIWFAEVPEPGTPVLLVMGALGLAFYGRRRR